MEKETLSFGTDGIRGHSEQYPFTNDVLHKLGRAIGLWAREKYGNNRSFVLIGSDTRDSCQRIKQALVGGLQSFSLTLVDGDVIPTPAVYQLMREDQRYAFGIVISASHNLYQDNGIKIFDALTGKLSSLDEQSIMHYFEGVNDRLVNVHEKQADKGVNDRRVNMHEKQAEIVSWPFAKQVYRENIQKLFPINFLKGITVVIDCANGATSVVAPELFAQSGAEVIVLSDQPDGKNINDHCGSLHPQALQQAVVAHHADMGFAFDGDGDRIVAVNKAGQLKDGDDILMLLAQLPCYADVSQIVGTVMANSGLEYALNACNKELVRVPVGDKYVVAKLDELNSPLGGEPSGHIIVRTYLPTSDALFVALKLLESIMLTNNWEMNSFDKFPQVVLNIPVVYKQDLSVAPYATIIAQHKAKMPKGRLLVRYSGTENILRIMTETEIYEDAYALAHDLAQQFQQAFKHHA